jgi:peptidoglycan/xylan/chitin deacetylase (PgdA/CDA1 family)
MRHALTVDVEDWFQVGAFEQVIDKANWDSLESRVERNTDAVLALFAESGVKATFFTLGTVGTTSACSPWIRPCSAPISPRRARCWRMPAAWR